MKSWIRNLSILAAIGVLAACGDSTSPNSSGDGGSGGEGGDGGAGGAGGVGGTGGGEPLPPDGSGWEGVEVRLDWHHQPFGEVFRLLAADFAGTGEPDLALGARRPALMRGDGSGVAWYANWEMSAELDGDDGNFTYGLAAIPSQGGAQDLLVSSSQGDAFLLDGRDGTRRWHTVLDSEYPWVDFATFGDEEDPLFFPVSGRAAYRAKTGEVAWKVPESIMPSHVHTARQGEGESTGVFFLKEMDFEFGRGGDKPIGHPILHSYAVSGEPVFEYHFPNTFQPMRMIPADLDGAGSDSAVVVFQYGKIAAIGPTGEERWEKTLVVFDEDWKQIVENMVSGDIDGDGKDEIFIVYRNGAVRDHSETLLVALDSEGNELWRQDFYEAINDIKLERLGGEAVLLLASGDRMVAGTGNLRALATEAGLTERERSLLFVQHVRPVTQVVLLPRGGETLIAFATDDGTVRVVRWPGGSPTWSQYFGTWLSALAVAEDVTVVGDALGSVFLLDSDGEMAWSHKLGEGNAWAIEAIAHGPFGEKREPRIVVGAGLYSPEGRGLLESYTLEGQRRLSRVVLGTIKDVAVADLDNDGRTEILYVEGDRGEDPLKPGKCRLSILEEDGTKRLEKELAVCAISEISIGDMDGDGLPEIAVRTDPLVGPEKPMLAVLNHDGSVRWTKEESLELSTWIHVGSSGLVTGGGTMTYQGFVALRDPATGEKVWKTLLPLIEGHPTLPNVPRHGVLVSHEGRRWIATHSSANVLYLLDEASGEIFWGTTLEDPATHFSRRHNGGPVTFVPATDDTPAFLAVGQEAIGRIISQAFAVSLDGKVQSGFTLTAPAHWIATTRRKDGKVGAVVGAKLGIHTLGIHAKGGE